MDAPASTAIITIDPVQYVTAVYAPFCERLAQAKADAEQVTGMDVTTKEGMAVAIKHRAVFRNIRLEAEEARKFRKAPILTITKLIDGKYAELKAEIAEYEDSFDAPIKAEEERKELERTAVARELERKRIEVEQAAKRAEEERLAAERAEIARQREELNAERDRIDAANLALNRKARAAQIIEDARLKALRDADLAASKQEPAAQQSGKPVQAPSGGQPQESAVSAAPTGIAKLHAILSQITAGMTAGEVQQVIDFARSVVAARVS